jgi:GTP cyclohydrolase I
MAINVAGNFALAVTVGWRFPDVILRQKTDVTNICEKHILIFHGNITTPISLL